MNFVPHPVVKCHNSYEDRRTLPGYQCDHRSNWDRLYRRFTHSQPDLLIFTRRDRVVAEYPGVMLMMHKGVSLKYAPEGRSMRAQDVLLVHQLAVHKMLDEGHQDARKDEPATDRKNKHERLLDSSVLSGRVVSSHRSRLST